MVGRVALVLALSAALAGCAWSRRDGDVVITRSLDIGLYHRCLGGGLGVMLCEEIRFDPKACALVVIFPKPPTLGQRKALFNLSHEVRAWCPEKETTP